MTIFNWSTFFMCSLLLCFGSCIGDEKGHCEPLDNIFLEVDYPNFSAKVDLLNVGIFNDQGVLIQKYKLDKNVLQNSHQLMLSLDKGQYTAICFSNTFENSKITPFEIGSKFSDLIMSPSNFNTLSPIHSNDSIHYGLLSFEAKFQAKKYTVHLKPTFIRLLIYIKSCPVNLPSIRINGLKPLLNANMTCSGNDVCYYPIIKEIKAEKLFFATSNVFRFKEDTAITIDILSNLDKNEILHTIKLKSLIENNHITITDGAELSIPILVEFEDNNEVSVSIMQVGWESTIIDPDLD